MSVEIPSNKKNITEWESKRLDGDISEQTRAFDSDSEDASTIIERLALGGMIGALEIVPLRSVIG